MEAQKEERTRERHKRPRNIAIIVASLLGLVLLAGLFLKLFKWVFGLLLLAALGYAIWYFIGPRISALFQRLRAGREQRRLQDEARHAEASRQQNIERTLEEIKRNLKQERPETGGKDRT